MGPLSNTFSPVRGSDALLSDVWEELDLVGRLHLCVPVTKNPVTENVTKIPPVPVTKIQEVTSSHMHRRVRKQGNAVPSGGKQRLPRRQLMHVTRRADQPRSGRKKARRSSASSSGCSIAAKWPPRGITVQRRILV